MRSCSGEKTDDIDLDDFEWIDGERIPAEEYEYRLQNQVHNQASLFLLHTNPDLNWIFGLDAVE